MWIYFINNINKLVWLNNMVLNLRAFEQMVGLTESNLNLSAFGVAYEKKKPTISPYTPIPNTEPRIIDVIKELPTGAGKVVSVTGGFLKDVGQSIARNIGSAALSFSAPTPTGIAEPLKADDFQSFFAQGLFENVFGKDTEIKPIETRIAEAEPKIKEWQKGLQEQLDTTPNLNAREKFVLKTLANLSPKSTAFIGIMGSVGMDLTPFGGLEKNAFKAITKTKTIGEALILGRKMGIADDLLENFAQQAVKVANDADAEKLFKSTANLQQTTVKAPIKPKTAPETTIVPKTELSTSISKAKASGQSFDEWVKGQGKPIYHGTNTKFEKFDPAINPKDYGTWFATDKAVIDETTMKYLHTRVLKPDIKLITENQLSKIENTKEMLNYEGKFHDYLMSKGYRGIKYGDGNIQLFNPETDTITRSQLKAEWDGVAKQLLIPEGLPKIRQMKTSAEIPSLEATAQSSRATSETTLGKASKEATTPQATPSLKPQAESQKLPVSKEKLSQPQTKSDTISYKDSVAQKSSVVKPKESVNLSPETYTANRTKLSEKVGKLQRAKDNLKAGLASIGEGADKILGTISTRLKNIDPSLKTAIRSYEFKLAGAVQKDRKAVEPFLKAIRSKDISKIDYADLDLALKNGDITKIDEVIKKYGLEKEFGTVRETLDDLYKRATAVGYDIGYEKNYFPRMVEDSGGMLDYFQKGDDWNIIDEAIKAKELDLGRYLTVKEKANTINTLIRGYPQGKITLSETGAMKARRIDIVDAELNQFYHDSVATLLRYVDETNDAIEARRFFGKGNKTDQFANVEDSIGAYTLDLLAKGKIKPSQEKELRDILHARFAEVGTSGAVRVYKNLSYIDTMGSVISAITQLGDLAFAIYKGGVVQTVKAFGKAVVGKSQITRADIGIQKIAQEFQDSARSANAVSKVFKLVGLEKLDALGKESVINASISRYRKLAEEPTTQFLKKMELIFGDKPEVISKVMDDLKLGKVTEDVKLIAFNELLDVQPVALSEMPEQYLKGGNGRIFYMLTTYTIKLFDVYRNEVFQTMKTNPVQGIKNLLYLTGALLVMNATADEIKDFILNRET